MRDPYDHSDPFDHFDYFGDFDPHLDPHPAFRLRRMFRRKRRTVHLPRRARELADTTSSQVTAESSPLATASTPERVP